MLASPQAAQTEQAAHGEPIAELLHRELVPRSKEVWTSVLGLELSESETPMPDTAPDEPRWTGCMAISGGWRGAVTISCRESLAQKATAAMFGMAPDEPSAAEIQDAIGELANILGGQTKQILGGSCSLGLPVVIEGGSFETTMPRSHVVVKLHFHCDGHPVEVAIVGADDQDGAQPDGVTALEN